MVAFHRLLLSLCCVLPATAGISPASALSSDDRLRASNWFDFESVADPRISPDGRLVVYTRRFNDIMTDRGYSNLWLVSVDKSLHRPLTTGRHSDSAPRWSHDGQRVVFVSDRDGGSDSFVIYIDDGRMLQVTRTPKSVSNLRWSPDDRSIAFTMPVDADAPKGVDMPKKPKGAEWADPPVVIDRLVYRFNRRGYLPFAYRHVFVVPSLGGTPRQLTSGDWDHGAPSWSPDGSRLYFSATRKPDSDWIVQDSEVYSVDLDGEIVQLTDRRGPDDRPIASPDGKHVAYVGFDEEDASYTPTHLYVMRHDGTGQRCLTASLDRTVSDVVWLRDGERIFVTVPDRGRQDIYQVTLDGTVSRLTGGMHEIRGLTVDGTDRFAALYSDPVTPSDVITLTRKDPQPQRLTHVNDDLLGHRTLGQIEEVWYPSSFDGKKIQGWIIKPPGFDASRKYPLVLYIHGGPHAMYGVDFSFEFQVHAADDYVVFYSNPRGSTGYGEEFGNIIQYNYPGDDYFDLISGVDEVISRGYIDEQNLFVTGGSGGGVLTCWVIGRTTRFAAAVSQYPVINWYSFVLTSDITKYVKKRWFTGFPWEAIEDHMRRSPISLVGNVTTPTLLITGEEDWRTPISESEQYYQALRIQKKDARLVRVPGEAHGIRGRPSHYIAKILHIAEWFERYKRGDLAPEQDRSDQD